MALTGMTLTKIFTDLGFRAPTRDDWKFVAAQVVGVASLIAANVVDLPTWFAYIGIPLTVIWVHRISVLATVILYLGGRYGKSPLPGAPK